MDNIVTFPGSSERKPSVAKPAQEQTEFGSSRSRGAVQTDIDLHIKARKAYGKAVAWEAAAQSEELPAYRIEEARCLTAMAYREMQEAARGLLICMPTDPKGLVDLLLYLEQNFSVLPDEITSVSRKSESLAFNLLRTVRLSLREIAGLRKGRS
jgi:hypothetical protein